MEPKSLWEEESPSFLHPSTSNHRSLVFTSQLICFISTLRRRFLTKPREFFLIFKLSILCYIFIRKLCCASIAPPGSPQHLQQPPGKRSGAGPCGDVKICTQQGRLPQFITLLCVHSAPKSLWPEMLPVPSVPAAPWEFQKATGSPDCPEDARKEPQMPCSAFCSHYSHRDLLDSLCACTRPAHPAQTWQT